MSPLMTCQRDPGRYFQEPSLR